MFVLNIDKSTNRILSVCETFNEAKLKDGISVSEIPEDGKANLYNYLYVNGEFVYSPIEKQEDEVTYQ